MIGGKLFFFCGWFKSVLAYVHAKKCISVSHHMTRCNERVDQMWLDTGVFLGSSLVLLTSTTGSQ